MPKRSSKAPQKRRPTDLNQLARSIVEQATTENAPQGPDPVDETKNPAAVALGKLGGKKGGPARAKALSAAKRKAIAKKAARVRWGANK